MNLLFWNLKGNDNSDLIRQALLEHEVDIAAYAEHGGIDFNALCSSRSGFPYRVIDPVDGPGKVRMLVRDGLKASSVFGQGRYMLLAVSCAAWRVNVVALHLQDQRSDPHGAARSATVRRLVSDLRELEQEKGCFDSVVIGDFNAQPYSAELVWAGLFNATSFKDVALRLRSKRVDGCDYPLMYNPTLEFLSEANRNCGSFYSASGAGSFYWYCLDQAIVSPSLAASVVGYSYTREIGGTSLMGPVAPKGSISDHLPLLVNIERSDS